MEPGRQSSGLREQLDPWKPGAQRQKKEPLVLTQDPPWRHCVSRHSFLSSVQNLPGGAGGVMTYILNLYLKF